MSKRGTHDTRAGRSQQHVKTRKREALKRAADTSGERGLSLQTKVGLAAVAQGEDDVDMRDRDHKLAVVISTIAATKELLTMYISFASGESDHVAKADHIARAKEYEQDILKLKKKLSDIASRKRLGCRR